jgi:hypothetical protein
VKKQQTMTLTVTTKGDRSPWVIVRRLLRDAGINVQVNKAGDVEEIPGPNRQRLIDLAVWVAGEHAKKELGLPSEWDQGAWLKRQDGVNDCGTTCCVAGKVALDDGAKPVPDYGISGEWADLREGEDSSLVILPGSDESVNVRDYAQKALGLTDAQASLLFEGNNDLDDVLNVIRDLLAETEDEAPASDVPTSRRTQAGTRFPCGDESCPLCYEDVPAEQPTDPEPVAF